MLFKKIERKLKAICTNEESLKQQEDIYALQQLKPISSDYTVWSSSSIRPSAMVQILNEIIVNNRNTIVEFGCGITTVYIAKILKQYGGHLYSVEDNAEWIEIVRTMLKHNDLLDMVTFIHAPLIESRHSLNNCDWYSEGVINNYLQDINIDMILIDGPPAYLKDIELSRYPAVPFLFDRLADDFCIILDDINRDGEKSIVIRWEKEINIDFVKQYVKGGIAIARSRRGFNT